MSDEKAVSVESFMHKRKGRGAITKTIVPAERFYVADMLVRYGAYPTFEAFMQRKNEEALEEYFQGAERLMQARFSEQNSAITNN